MAQQPVNHYDNLKVLRTAPVEVIKASYRALSQKYHPDRNPDPDALHSMQLINQAWDVLSDPDKRATHDRWIDSQPQQATPAGARRVPHKYAPHVAAALAAVLLISFITLQFINAHNSTRDTAAALAPVASVPEQPVDAATASLRQPDGYITSEVQYFSDGQSSIEIDNTGTAADAEVRLERSGRTARSMHVHQGKIFLVGQLPPGTYTMKYKITDHGKTRAYRLNTEFQLDQSVEETSEGRQARFSELRVSLAKVTGGTREITLDEF